MPRVIRHPEIRRTELIAIGGRLFAKKGYEATSIDDIVREANLSKGAFYHHFASKDALLEAMAASFAEAALMAVSSVMRAADLTAVERLDLFLRQGRTGSATDGIATFGAIFRAESLGLYHRLHRAVARVLVGPLTRVIEQGIAEGSMRSANPGITAEIVLALGPVTYDAVGQMLVAIDDGAREQALRAFGARLVQQAIAVDRILGLPDGSISFWDAATEAQWRVALGG